MASRGTDTSSILNRTPGKGWKPNQLCAKCSLILTSSRDGLFSHWETTKKIRDAAYSGCHMCSLIHGSFPLVSREACQPSSEVRVDGPWEAEFLSSDDRTTNRFTIKLHVSDRRSQSYQIMLDGSETFPGDEQPVKSDERDMSSFADSTGSATSLQTAKAWLEGCMSQHSNVCADTLPEPTNLLPTRLIEVDDQYIRLWQTDSCSATIRYLILSYCWGTEQDNELKLTHENETRLREGIAVTDLPRTILDAVIVTKKLGYRYLWVDRLCIIQDTQGNADDWNFEAKRMQSYYMKADCCIAALVPKDSHQGMFQNRNPLLLQPLNFQNDKTGEHMCLSARSLGGAAGHYPVLYRGSPYALSQRAWVLQERLLAPRTIYFGSLMLYWECRSTRHAEHVPGTDLSLPFSRILRKFGSRAARTALENVQETVVTGGSGEEDLWTITHDDRGLDSFCDKWADMVGYYTKCDMTFPRKDRLMAITGMMNSITARAGPEFVHGLMKSRLSSELLWWQWVRCNGDRSILPVRIGEATKCPTWSWGSVQGYIQPFLCYRFLQVQRRDPWQFSITISLESLDRHSILDTYQVTTATINAICRVDVGSPLVEVQIGDRVDLVHYTWRLQAVVQGGVTTFLSFALTMWPDEPILKGQTVWLMNCASMQRESNQPVHFAGLVIVPISATQIRYWRRVGYWHSTSGVRLLDAPTDEQRRIAARTSQIHQLFGGKPSTFLV